MQTRIITATVMLLVLCGLIFWRTGAWVVGYVVVPAYFIAAALVTLRVRSTDHTRARNLWRIWYMVSMILSLALTLLATNHGSAG